MDLDRLVEAAPAWCARLGDGTDVWTGPEAAFGGGPAPTHRVARLAVDALAPPATPGTAVPVHESGAGSFSVEHHDLGGWTGVWHPVGRNWVLVSSDGQRWAVGGSPSPAQSWVHVRFVLRHLVTAHLLARPRAQVVHAVAARHDSGGDPVVAVVGPTTSGKTRLVNRLVATGVLDEVVEDDCAVVADGALAGLFPTEHELRRLRVHPIGAVVALDETVDRVREGDLADVARWAAACQVPWPVDWLPGAPTRPSTPTPFAAGTTCIVAPIRRDDDPTVVAEIARLLRGA